MPVRRHLLRPDDHDILRKPLIQRIGDALRRDPRLRIKNRRVSQRVDSGIGTARADDPDLLPQEPGQFTVEHLFHRDPVGLYLPAAVVRAVIGDGDPDPLHKNLRNCFFNILTADEVCHKYRASRNRKAA